MNSFSFDRFCKTFRWYLAVNCRSLLMWMAGICMGTFLGELLFLTMGSMGMISLFFTIFLMIAYGVGISTMFYDLNKKARRETFLMLPASHLEKFFSAVIYVTIIWGIAILLSFVVGDALRMLFRSLVFGDVWTSATPSILRNMAPNVLLYNENVYSVSYTVMNLVVMIGFLFFLHSVYVLGATLFRKYAFVATTVVVILFGMLCGWSLKHFELILFTSVWDGDVYKSQYGLGAYILAVMFPIAAYGAYTTAFRIFKDYQLISNKWTNGNILKR